MPLSKQIVQEARTWIGTRFAHQGRQKQTLMHYGGVDCLGLLVGVAHTLDLRDKHGRALYRHDRCDYTKCPKGEELMRALRHALTAIPTAHACAGDVALFSIEGNPQHVGILSDYNVTTLGLIHAYAPARAVVEHVLDISWQHRITGAFRII